MRPARVLASTALATSAEEAGHATHRHGSGPPRGPGRRYARACLDQARRRAGAETVLARRRRVRGGTSPWHRSRRAGGVADSRSRERNGHVRGNRPERRTDAHDLDAGRVRRHARPPRNRRRRARRRGGRGFLRGDGRAEWDRRASRAVRPLRRPRRGGAGGLRRPDDVPRARERAARARRTARGSRDRAGRHTRTVWIG